MDLLTAEQIEAKIRGAFPDARVVVTDLTGTRDHWQVEVVSQAFEGLNRLARQRRIYDLFQEELKGPLHALTLKTRTPEEAAQTT